MMTYNPEVYWSRVAQEIENRTSGNLVAGDDNPYYRYKRRKFLKRFLDTIDFDSNTALEIGFGPGGNLKHIATYRHPKTLYGVDISQKMCDLASRNLGAFRNIKLAKTDGMHLPFADHNIDISFTVTVLQHVTDESMLRALVRDISRVTRLSIIIMEDIGTHPFLSAQGSATSRTIEAYHSVFAESGFQLNDVSFLGTKVSRRWYDLAWRGYRCFLHPDHQEGDAIKLIGRIAIGAPLVLTSVVDSWVKETQNLAKLSFRRS
jgi:SAM-dependent methyltransferase